MKHKIHRLPGVIPGRVLVEKPPSRRSGAMGIGLIILGGLAGIYWYFFLGPTFMVRSVEIVGSDHALLRSVGDRLVGVNIFRLNPASIEQEVRQIYPAVESVTVARGLPRVVRLTIHLREPAIKWQVDGTTYILDSNGEVFEEGDKPDYAILPKVTDTTGKSLQVGQQVVSPAFIQMVREIKTYLPEQLGREYTDMEITETSFNIDILLEEGVRLRLTTQRPAQEQIDAAKLVLANHPNAKMVDVRIARWGYWK